MSLFTVATSIKRRLFSFQHRRPIVTESIVGSKVQQICRFGIGDSRRTISTGATRGATAAASRNAKERIVRLLFQDEDGEQIFNGNKSLNVSDYSYTDLRRAYLKRLQVIHPDKANVNFIDTVPDQYINNERCQKRARLIRSKEELTKDFQELRSAWDRYEELSKDMTKVIRGDGKRANFTEFGVGCSFSDNEKEKALRKEITDQACRGWFSSGLMSSGLSNESDDNVKSNRPSDSTNENTVVAPDLNLKQESLLDDSMFVQAGFHNDHDESSASSRGTKMDSTRRHQRTLIPGINLGTSH